MEDLWNLFWVGMGCLGKECRYGSAITTYPISCTNNALTILLDVILCLIFLFSFVCKPSSRQIQNPTQFQQFTRLEKSSVLFNVSLGLVYLSLGIWMWEEMLRRLRTALPLLCWLPMLIHGFIWLFVSLTVSLRRKKHSKAFLVVWSIFAFLCSGVLSVFALMHAIANKRSSVRIVSDVLSFPGAVLLLCVYKMRKAEEIAGTAPDSDLCTPLNSEAGGSSKTDSNNNEALFGKAGFVSSMSFWWLNPLMARGKEKILEDKDMPQLRKEDCAGSCYSQFLEQLNLQTQIRPSTPPSLLRTLIVYQWKGILLSEFFALLKTLILSCGPLFLSAFIMIAEGKKTFTYAGYVLAVSLFLAKCLESLSQRQWFFRSRVVGLQVRSLLSAAIYKKQMRLSTAAKLMHSSGEIMNYVTVDAYRIGEFPYWFHQMWTCGLQLCIELVILMHAVGIATGAALVVIALTVLCNVPLGKLQNKFQTKFMVAQGERVKATSEALLNMKVLKLYAWERQFKKTIENLRAEEYRWLSAVQLLKAYNAILFWSSPIVVSAVTFGACYLLGIPLYASNVFTFISALRLVQDPIRAIPDVIGVLIQANVALDRVGSFLDAPELQTEHVRRKCDLKEPKHCISIKSYDFSWEGNPLKPNLTNINLEVKPGQKVAICGEVGSGKSTLLAAMLGEVSNFKGTIKVYGEIAYVSQTAWIQTGTIKENILFGSTFDRERYQETLEKCSLLTDLEVLPFGDLTEIGERGVNLSGGQKQRIQLARALYQDADIYLLDDPLSAVYAHTAKHLFNEYVMEALSGKTVILVTHQVDFLPAFNTILLLSSGEILHAAPYLQLLISSQEFWVLANAHKETSGSEGITSNACHQRSKKHVKGIMNASAQKQLTTSADQLIKIEEKEIGNVGLRPYIQYLNNKKGYIYFTFICLLHITFTTGQILQNTWMAANVMNPHISEFRLIIVYLIIGLTSTILMLARFPFLYAVGMRSSKSLFSQLMISLFRAPMSFYESTPLGRILTWVSSDLSIVDLDIAFTLTAVVVSTVDTYAILGVLAIFTWKVLFVSIPMVYLAICLQRYYFASAKELMRINGTTKSMLANHLAESIAGATTIRAFRKEERFFAQNLDLIDKNASPYFHNFTATEWLIQRLEILSATVLSSSALAMILLPTGTFSSGFIGMALSYGLTLNMTLIYSIQNQCILSNYIISVERLNQYMQIPPEAPEVRNENCPPPEWPAIGRVEIHDLKIRYRPDTPLVLCGISSIFEGGHKIGIVGRTGSGKTTLISALFRLVEPAGGKIIIDGIDISTLGLHDLRPCIGIIPQDPTLSNGTVRYNMDPLSQHTDLEIWEVLRKCQLQEVVKDKEEGLDTSVAEAGSNWSVGHRQLFCLGRALLRRNHILVLDEATASIDNATDTILQRTIRTEFANCTVITVAHRILTVMDCTMVLSISNGNLVEYDEPQKLMNQEGSLFGALVKEYWSRSEINKFSRKEP